MNLPECLAKMKSPGEQRGPACYGVMQIVVTSRCDEARCSNCTQLIQYRPVEDMTLANVKRAIDSVAEYPGVVGIFGGNPCLHADFDEISRYLSKRIPDQHRRGLWANNINGHGPVIRDVYGYFNLNVHRSTAHADEIRRDLPGVKIWGEMEPSMHGPVLVAMSDLIPDESTRYELIAKCDVNQRWSPAMVQIDGELTGWFCEVAAAIAAVDCDGSLGVAPDAGWWRQAMPSFRDQVEMYCHDCGAPLRMAPRADSEYCDDISERWKIQPARGCARTTVVHSEVDGHCRELTDYLKLRGE